MTVFIKCFEKNSKNFNEIERGCAESTTSCHFLLNFSIIFNSF